MKGYKLRILIPASFFAGCLILFIPLLREFHVEFAILGALIGSVWGIIAGAQKPPAWKALRAPLISITLFAVPSVIRVLVLECFSVDGLGYWLLYPYPSLLLWFYLTHFLRGISNRPVLISSLLCFIVAVPMFLMEAWLFPQVYFHNHVWGGWPGPIYDQQLSLDDSVFFFRWITLLWAVIFYIASSTMEARWRLGFTGAAALGLMLSYGNLTENRIISPEPYIQQQLGGEIFYGDIVLYYPQHKLSPDEARLTAQRLQFHTDEITDTLNVHLSEPLRVYVYAHAWQKHRYTGAKFTNYVPVWNRNAQMHINLQDLKYVERHELVHVIAREFGNSILKASWSAGLVEGLAVALAPNYGRNATPEQMLAGSDVRPDASEISYLFSPTGFYAGRGPMNYAISGAFTQYLLQHYDPVIFKKAYRTSDINVYENLAEITDRWHAHLDTVAVSEEEKRAGERLFSIPSIFEETCARKMSRADKLQDQLRYAITRQDTLAIFEYSDQLFALQHHPEAWQRYLIRNLNFLRNPEDININPFEIPKKPAVLFPAADIALMRNEPQLAQQYVELAAYEVPSVMESDSWKFRSDIDQWNALLSAQYFFHELSFDDVLELPASHQIIALNRVLQRERADIILRWSDHPGFAETIIEHKQLISGVLRILIHHQKFAIADVLFELSSEFSYSEIITLEIDELQRYRNWISVQ